MNVSQLIYLFVPIDGHLSYFFVCVCCKQYCYEHFRLLLPVQGQEFLQIMSPEVNFLGHSAMHTVSLMIMLNFCSK